MAVTPQPITARQIKKEHDNSLRKLHKANEAANALSAKLAEASHHPRWRVEDAEAVLPMSARNINRRIERYEKKQGKPAATPQPAGDLETELRRYVSIIDSIEASGRTWTAARVAQKEAAHRRDQSVWLALRRGDLMQRDIREQLGCNEALIRQMRDRAAAREQQDGEHKAVDKTRRGHQA